LSIRCVAARGNELFIGIDDYHGVYHSIDDGDHWAPINDGLPQPFWDVHALSANSTHIFAALDSGIYRLGNGDTRWTTMDRWGYSIGVPMVVGDDFITGVTHDDPNSGVKSVDLLYSTDNGDHWSVITDGLKNLTVMDFAANSTHLFVATDGSGVWQRPLADLVSSVPVAPSASSPLSSIELHPNPVAATTELRYHLAARTHVTITIHDALGHIVSRPVVDTMQESGEHQIALITDELAAGVYLCSLRASGLEQAIRFVVVR
jgi:hypothetical protein